MATPVISILNMKGGVGKTTVSAHLFRVFYLEHQIRILLIDLDPQFNLTQCIISQETYDKAVDSGKTVLSCFEPPPSNDFFKVKRSLDPPPAAENLTIRLKQTSDPNRARLDLIVGDFRIVKYSLIDDNKQLDFASDYFKIFIAAAKKNYDLIVLDCNPSSSFITRCALGVSTHILSPVRPDKYSVIGVTLVEKLITHLDLSIDQIILMNGATRASGPTSVESELRAHPTYGGRVLVNRLPYTKLLYADQTYTGFATDRRVPWSGTLRKELGQIADELAARLGF